MTDTFTITVNGRRKVRVSYRKEGMHHVYSSPDLAGSATFHADKNRAYIAFSKRMKELVG